MIQLRTFFIACSVLSLLIAGTAFAQSPTATISGVVHDQTGAVLPGVSIQVINRETSAIVSARSGTPFTAQLGFNRSNDGNSDAPERPNLRAGGLPNRFPLLADGSYSGSAGVIQSLATSSRQIQFGLRYSF
jgi:hypothetical protein